MEYIRGETLAEKMRRRADVSLSQKLQLLSELCAGLAHAHESEIIHRDIKPANLMVDPHGRLKILDFGIARASEIGRTRVGIQLTRLNVQIGTPGYMSPEQIEAQPIDTRSDVFAVGAVAYELIAYREAFPGATTRQIENKVVGEDPQPLTMAVEGLSEIAAVIGTALEKTLQALQDARQLERADGFVRGWSRRAPRCSAPPAPVPAAHGERKPPQDRAVRARTRAGRPGANEFACRSAMVPCRATHAPARCWRRSGPPDVECAPNETPGQPTWRNADVGTSGAPRHALCPDPAAQRLKKRTGHASSAARRAGVRDRCHRRPGDDWCGRRYLVPMRPKTNNLSMRCRWVAPSTSASTAGRGAECFAARSRVSRSRFGAATDTCSPASLAMQATNGRLVRRNRTCGNARSA